MYGSLPQSNITQSEYQIYFKVFVCILKWIKGFNEKLNYEPYFQIPLKIAVWTDFMQTWQRKRSKKPPRIFLYLYSVMMQVQVLVSVPVVIWEKCTSFIFKRNILSRFYEMLIVLTLCEVVTYNLLPTDTMIYKDRLKLRLY